MDNKILYTFFEKSMASNQMIQKGSSIPENIKTATLNSETVRIGRVTRYQQQLLYPSQVAITRCSASSWVGRVN